MGNLGVKSATNRDASCGKSEGTSINLSGIKGRIDSVHIEGLGRTSEELIQPILRELFNARDFQEICQKAHHARDKMHKLGCFKEIKVAIDASSGPGSSKNGFEVTFLVKEHNRIVGGINTLVGHHEASLALSLKLPNILGGGELVNAEYSYGSKRSSNFTISATRPFFCKIPLYLTASLFQQGSVWPPSGYRLTENGALLDICFNSTPVIKHNFQWETCLREVGSLSSETAFQVREVTGPDMKTTFRHIISYDARDLPIFPTCGPLCRIATELAGLAGGDVGFLKNEVKMEYNYSIYNDLVLQGSCSLGHLVSLFEKEVGLPDQFYLGGPLILRGFDMRGIGPKANSNTLGSDLYWTSCLHLYFPAPFAPENSGFVNNFRGHLFLNMGNISDTGGELSDLKENIRMAYGVGFVLRLGQSAKLELNYCFPTWFQESDKTVDGVQFGIGVDFS